MYTSRPVFVVVLGTAILLRAGREGSQAMPNANRPQSTNNAVLGFLPSTQTNVQPAGTNLQSAILAGWLSQQVATRAQNAAREAALAKLEQATSGKAKVRFRQNGTPAEIKGHFLEHQFLGKLSPGMTHHEETTRTFLRANRGLLLSEDPDQEFELRKSEPDELGWQHLRFRQKYAGLAVWPCELITHLDRVGNLVSMEGAFIPTPRGLGTKPTMTAEQAVVRAAEEVAKGPTTHHTPPELIIYGPLDEPARLAWKFDLSAGIGQAWSCIVDALNGSILASFNLVNEGAVTGSGVDGLGVTRTLNLWQQGATYFMVDTSKPMYDNTSTPPNPNTTRGAIFIWDAQNQPPTSQVTTMPNNSVQVTSAGATSGWIADAVGAAFGLSQTYDYYYTRFARNSLDGLGSSMNGFVRVGINWPNAQWLGDLKIMRFGDGLTRAIDVCGHELTHGVINSIGDGGILNYHDQPGALNEALADIFGQNVKARTKGSTDWLVGTELTGSIQGPIRNMMNPGALTWAANNPYPSTMSQFYVLPPTTDAGGVHINSSIINHCYYLLAAGMTGAIDITNAERIFYRAMTLHLAKESQFIDARYACVASAEELFGTNSVQAQKTGQAFDAVEIADAPTTPPPSPVPTVPAADSTLFLRWDPFANGFLGAYELFRREAAQGDSVDGTLINTVKYLAPGKVSVSGDGSFVFYVTADNDYGAVNTDGSSATVAGNPGLVHSLAMTPDGNKFAFVLLGPAGQPTNIVHIVDLVHSTTIPVKLYAIDSEGNKLDIIQYADVLDFTSDGQRLIYDAYSQSGTAASNVLSGWTMYALDLATTNILALINLNANYDIGNPCVGRTRNNLLTFEARNKQTGYSVILASDLFSGNAGLIGQLAVVNALGKPEYAGDDRNIVYSVPDAFVNSLYDLVGQPVATDGITTNGAAFLWLSDADYVCMYRRGTFVATNALPSVTLTNPVKGQIFPPGANIRLQASASDSDGSIAKVEFYQGSTKLGEATTAPQTLTWSNVPSGKYNLAARAIDNLGGTTDSSPVAIIVANRPALGNASRPGAGQFQFVLTGDAGSTYAIQVSTNLVNWSSLTNITDVAGTVTFRDTTATNAPRRFYRALLQ